MFKLIFLITIIDTYLWGVGSLGGEDGELPTTTSVRIQPAIVFPMISQFIPEHFLGSSSIATPTVEPI